MSQAQPQFDQSLLTRSVARMISPTDRLPMVYRDGAQDFKQCARIEGPWRVYPDGTREPKDAKPRNFVFLTGNANPLLGLPAGRRFAVVVMEGGDA